MKNSRIIGIHGKARSGKDTLAKLLTKLVTGQTSIYHFADPIRGMVEFLIGELPTYVDDNGIVQYNKEVVLQPYGRTLRYMLQTLGTEWGRMLINENIWILQAEKFVEDNKGKFEQILFPDVRFFNEANFIRQMGGIVVQVNRKDRAKIGNETHSSEDTLLDCVDSYVNNDGTVEDLQSVAEFLQDHYDVLVAMRENHFMDQAI